MIEVPNLAAIANWLKQLNATQVTFALDESVRGVRIQVTRPNDKMSLVVSDTELSHAADQEALARRTLEDFEIAFSRKDNEPSATSAVTASASTEADKLRSRG